MARRPNACQTHVRAWVRRGILCLPPRVARDPHERGKFGRTRLSGIPEPRWHAGALACAAGAARGYAAQTLAIARAGVKWRESGCARDLSLLAARLIRRTAAVRFALCAREALTPQRTAAVAVLSTGG